MNEFEEYMNGSWILNMSIIRGYLEDHSRRNNLRINGIKQKVGESWEDCEAEVEKLFREKLDIEDKIIIQRAHRAKRNKKQQKNPVKDNHLLSAKF